MNFDLHPKLAKKIFVLDLPLCKVLLEDNKHYPWVLLVPRKAGISKIIDLEKEERLFLYEEVDCAQRIIWEAFKPFQLNVAALSNKVPQLHIHIIARSEDDPAWPGPVWDHPQKTPYSESEKEDICKLLRSYF